jgi:hypothetical protein
MTKANSEQIASATPEGAQRHVAIVIHRNCHKPLSGQPTLRVA